MKLMSAKKAAEIWGIFPRRFAVLCCEGRVPGAQMFGRSLVVPANNQKPADARVQSGQYAKVKEPQLTFGIF